MSRSIIANVRYFISDSVPAKAHQHISQLLVLDNVYRVGQLAFASYIISYNLDGYRGRSSSHSYCYTRLGL